MDWKDVAKTVGKVAPLIGGALGGPAGAAVGSLAARALGADETPEAMMQAMGNPDAVLKLQRLEQEHEREILSLTMQAETARLTEINATMRAELNHEGVFKSGWRPALGWVFAGSLGGFIVVMGIIALRDHSVVTNQEFTGMVVWAVATMGAALGINVRERSKDKARQLGQAPRTFLDALQLRK